jgi:hypothetical protein
MDDAGFIKLVFYLFIAPFWLAWKASVLAWRHIFKPLNQSIADKKADAKQKELDDANQAARDARATARQKQLDALRAAAPKSLPENLRATIQINSVTVVESEQRRIPRTFANDSIVYIDGPEKTKYAVDMILELSETERAIIKEHNLQDYLLEDEPLYSPEDLARRAEFHQGYAASYKDPDMAEFLDQHTQEMMNLERAARRQTKLGDYLVVPYTRIWEDRIQANQYSEKLKTKILPQIKSILDVYKADSGPQTIHL